MSTEQLLREVIEVLREENEGLTKRVAELEAEARDDHWPHGATVKIRWVGVGYCEKKTDGQSETQKGTSSRCAPEFGLMTHLGKSFKSAKNNPRKAKVANAEPGRN